MGEKYRERARILTQEEIAPGIYSMRIRTDAIAECAVPGQFLSLYCDDESRILPRPISLCEIDREGRVLRLVYRVAGAGTGEFSGKRAGDEITVLGPLGNGFPLYERPAVLIGGGIGIPPMLELAKQYPGDKSIVLGYNNSDTFLSDEFEKYGGVYIASEDGGAGTKGTVIDAVRAGGLTGDVLYACGPLPMLRAVRDLAEETGAECLISVEERMACGIGACLACVCRSAETDAHTNVKNRRVCREGPVFNAREIEL